MQKWVENFTKDFGRIPFLAMPANANSFASLTLSVDGPLGPIYTKRQHQHCDKFALTLVILFSLKTIESLQDGVAIHFQVSPFISMRIQLCSLMTELSLMLSMKGPFMG